MGHQCAAGLCRWKTKGVGGGTGAAHRPRVELGGDQLVHHHWRLLVRLEPLVPLLHRGQELLDRLRRAAARIVRSKARPIRVDLPRLRRHRHLPLGGRGGGHAVGGGELVPAVVAGGVFLLHRLVELAVEEQRRAEHRMFHETT